MNRTVSPGKSPPLTVKGVKTSYLNWAAAKTEMNGKCLTQSLAQRTDFINGRSH